MWKYNDILLKSHDILIKFLKVDENGKISWYFVEIMFDLHDILFEV